MLDAFSFSAQHGHWLHTAQEDWNGMACQNDQLVCVDGINGTEPDFMNHPWQLTSGPTVEGDQAACTTSAPSARNVVVRACSTPAHDLLDAAQTQPLHDGCLRTTRLHMHTSMHAECSCTSEVTTCSNLPHVSTKHESRTPDAEHMQYTNDG